MKNAVILPTFNSFQDKQGSLALAVESILAQSRQPDEMIIVDNGSTDESWQYIDSLCRRVKWIRGLKCPRPGNRSLARNVGIEASQAEWVVFLEDDLLFHEANALERMLSRARSSTFQCGAARWWLNACWKRDEVLAALGSGELKRLCHLATLPRGIKRSTGFRDLQEFSFIGHCGGVCRRAFERAGQFDAVRFDGWGREDVDLMLRLIMSGADFDFLFHEVSIFHLTHPLAKAEKDLRSSFVDEYLRREVELGVVFKVNHLFGVTEGDGDGVIWPRPSAHPQIPSNWQEAPPAEPIFRIESKGGELVEIVEKVIRWIPDAVWVGLAGSAAHNSAPLGNRDVDIVAICPEGASRFFVVDSEDGTQLEMQRVSWQYISSLSSHYFEWTDNWVWEIGKWVNAEEIWCAELGAGQELARLADVTPEQLTFFVTYYLGKLLKSARRMGRGQCWPPEVLDYARVRSALLFLLQGEWPSFYNPRSSSDLALDGRSEHLQGALRNLPGLAEDEALLHSIDACCVPLMSHLSTPQLLGRCLRYPDNWIGAKHLVERWELATSLSPEGEHSRV